MHWVILISKGDQKVISMFVGGYSLVGSILKLTDRMNAIFIFGTAILKALLR